MSLASEITLSFCVNLQAFSFRSLIGGGLELHAFADMHPEWSFCGVDPSAEMLVLAKRTLGPPASRVDLHEGYIDSAPVGRFDGATCLLTLHFISETSAGARWIRCTRGRGPVLPSSSPTTASHRMAGKRQNGSHDMPPLQWRPAYRPRKRRVRSRLSVNGCRSCLRSRRKPAAGCGVCRRGPVLRRFHAQGMGCL